MSNNLDNNNPQSNDNEDNNEVNSGIITFNPTTNRLRYTLENMNTRNIGFNNDLQRFFISNLIRNYIPPPTNMLNEQMPENSNELSNENSNELSNENDIPLLENQTISADEFLSGISGLLLNSRRNFRLNRNMSQLLIESFNQKPAYKNVLSEDGEDQLVHLKYKDSSKSNSSCPIYYVDFEDESNVIQLPCNHVFTPDGIEKWLKEEKNECPICRFELKHKEVAIKKNIDENNNNNETEINNEENNRSNQLYNSLQASYAPLSQNSFGNIPHSYLDSIFAREEEQQMEQAILASIQDFENQQNQEENIEENQEDNPEDNQEEKVEENKDNDINSLD